MSTLPQPHKLESIVGSKPEPDDFTTLHLPYNQAEVFISQMVDAVTRLETQIEIPKNKAGWTFGFTPGLIRQDRSGETISILGFITTASDEAARLYVEVRYLRQRIAGEDVMFEVVSSRYSKSFILVPLLN